MTSVKTSLQFEVRGDLGVERVENEILILDKCNEKIHRLNATAAFIWEGLAMGQDAEEIVTEIVEIFDTPVTVVRQDVDRATALFVDLGLLEKSCKQIGATNRK